MTEPEKLHRSDFDKDPEPVKHEATATKQENVRGVTTRHPLRRGSITHKHLDNEVPKRVVSDRCDVSEGVLTKHYDRQTADRKREIREQYLEDI